MGRGTKKFHENNAAEEFCNQQMGKSARQERVIPAEQKHSN